MATEVPASFADDIAAIDRARDKLAEDNRKMRRLLAQVTLFVACQPENHFRNKWLKEAEELTGG